MNTFAIYSNITQAYRKLLFWILFQAIHIQGLVGMIIIIDQKLTKKNRNILCFLFNVAIEMRIR